MPIEILNIETLPSKYRQLLFSARDVSHNAYNIYSSFYVGAAVRTISKNVYCGTFMENASLGLTVCAEPSALLAANNAGDFNVTQLAVVGGTSLNSSGDPVTPCGRCRQMIYEASQVSGRNIEIICANTALTSIILTSISELLPLPFGPNDLGLQEDVSNFKKRQMPTIHA